jgi:hypothetical protein
VSHVAVLRAILLYSCEIVACDVVAMEKEQAFEIVSKIIFDDACQLIMGLNKFNAVYLLIIKLQLLTGSTLLIAVAL